MRATILDEISDRSPMETGRGNQHGRGHAGLDPELLRRLLRAKDRMDAASHEEWPVQRLARVSHVSAAHFARSFKEAFGVPPHRYLLTRRIERATALLRETDLPITEIAFQTGWESLGTFGHLPRHHRREPEREPGARTGRGEPARPRPQLHRQRRPPARPRNRSFGEAAPRGGRYKSILE